MTQIDAIPNSAIKIELTDLKENAYVNFIESIQSYQTRRNYTRDLKVFLMLVPKQVYVEHNIEDPKSQELEDLCISFVNLAKMDTGIIKTMIKSYVTEIKKIVNSGKLSPNSVSNRLKPIKALLSANEIDVSWKLINKMLPRRTKSEDRAYTREEIHKMIECCTDVTDKVIILMFSSAGFRLESWDYFCWKDVIFFKDKTQQYTGAALRVYRGDPEEYWTFITPEACHTLELYKEEWRSRFLKYPDNDDPLIASTRFDRPVRLQSKGVRSRVDKIVTKIGLRDEIKKNQRRYEVKLDHGFRKYFNTMMRRAKVNYLDKEDMMGHKVGLEQAYERYQEEDFERFPEYQKAIPFLTISDEERLRLEAAEKQEDIEKLEQKNEEVQGLRNRIDNLENGLEARRPQYEKGRLASDNSLTSRFINIALPLWFESRASESEKKEIWKKLKKENLSKGEIINALGVSKGLSWDNLSESVKQFEEDQSKENTLE